MGAGVGEEATYETVAGAAALDSDLWTDLIGIVKSGMLGNLMVSVSLTLQVVRGQGERSSANPGGGADLGQASLHK